MLFKVSGVLLCLAVLLSCLEGSSSWHYDELCTGHADFDSVRLFYPPCDVTVDLGVELVWVRGGFSGYLYVSQREVPLSEAHQDEARVSYSIGDDTQEFFAKRMKGGHCLLLPLEIAEEMMQAWQAGRSVKVATDGGFCTSIEPLGFSKAQAKSQRRTPSTTH